MPPTPPPVEASRHRRLGWVAAIVLLAVVTIAVFTFVNRDRERAPTLQCVVVNTFPHDPAAYCQGLTFHQGSLYEGTGQYGRSSIRRVDLATGKIAQQRDLAGNMFGEGITIWDKSVIQLTWKSRTALHYDVDSFELQRKTGYRGEGWGLTHDGTMLIMSDGTATLRFLDPTSFSVKRRLTVRDGTRRIIELNELEYIEGKIYANIWYEDRIARISPQTGQVEAWIDLGKLLPTKDRPHDDAVLNGIAYDAEQKRIFVTGKHWPSIFEIRVVE
jgi:glutamine cyclotransferase